ncbi:MAG: hypothetical protein ABI759_22590 [Candidatus Solibacter sp.]
MRYHVAVQSQNRRLRWWTWLADGLLVFAVATILVRPLFKSEYLDAWSSIESTFISDARFLSDHWVHPAWQPNWYGGTRTDYVYPPMLRYGTAFLSRAVLRHPSTARSYHLYIALLYALGIAAVYVFVRTGSRSRWVALWVAAASATISPCFLLFKDQRIDSQGVHWMPLRLGVLVRYGEGPHMSAWALLPFALAAAWYGLRRGHPGRLALSGVMSALVVANNFYGATALAIFFSIVVWSVFLAEQDWRVWLRAAAIAAIAFGLDAFWLTPSFLRITLSNMKLVSSPGHVWSEVLGAVVLVVYAAISWRLARGKREHAWSVFVAGALAIFGLNVIGNQYYDFRVLGEPGRLIPELDFVIFIAAGLLFAWLARRGRWYAAGAAVLAVGCLAPGIGYLQHAWQVLPPKYDQGPQQRVEYVIADWVSQHLPGVRTLATGSVRFWYNAWHDLPQLGGGAEQGVLNIHAQYAYGHALGEEDPDLCATWLQALGTGAVIVHDKTSKELYHDWGKPEKFEGKLEKVYDHEGDLIYRVPRRYPALARVVDAASMAALPVSDAELNVNNIHRYVDVVERGPEAPVQLWRNGTDEIHLKARLAPGQRLLVQESHDPAWRAYAGGKPVATAKDPVGFLLLDPGAGEQEVVLRFETPLENRMGQALGVLALLAVLALGWRSFSARSSPETLAV